MSVITLDLNEQAEILLENSAKQLGTNYNDLINQSIINFCQNVLSEATTYKMSLQQTLRERGFGALEGKVNVKFADDWHITNEDLLSSQ